MQQSRPCTTNCEWDGRDNYKWGAWDQDNPDSIIWTVAVKAPANGMAGGEEIVVTENSFPDQTLDVSRSAEVWQANELATTNGATSPTGWRQKPASEYTVSADGKTVTFTAEAGFYYDVKYFTKTTNPNLEVFTNNATVKIGTEEPVTVNSEVERVGGSAGGIGTNVGRFAVTKTVEGSTDTSVTGIGFTVNYVVTPPTGDPISDSFTVANGQTWQSPDFPRDSTVTLTEVQPVGPANATWETPVFSESSFTLVGGTQTEITLTNKVTVETSPPTTPPVTTPPDTTPPVTVPPTMPPPVRPLPPSTGW